MERMSLSKHITLTQKSKIKHKKLQNLIWN